MCKSLSVALCLLAAFPTVHAADRPNILWITAEDMSPTLGCYGDEYATTPHIDRLASESVRYTHAFATAPVCSPVRSCLITGCYATSLGTHNMRSAYPLPDFIRGFPSYLREAGYFTTNNVKTDYNSSSWERLVKESWDESSSTAHWRKRPEEDEDKPFFSVFNLMTSHQSRSMVWTYERFVEDVQSQLTPEEIHAPDEAPLPPYYPDTPVIRKTVARFYDCVTAMDKEVGTILKQLEDDGLADDTIVFFFSDHGSGMPRHKRALLDSGMHVPLLVRFPKKYRDLAPTTPGQTTNRLVSFVDFPATVLSLADIEHDPRTHGHMQGRPFLGKQTETAREYVYGHRDRVDEVIDVARSIRDRRYLYIRNYMPHLGYNQPTAWPDLGQIRHEFYRLADQGKMTDAQWQFAGPTRPVEELYDCENDPFNLTNLATSEDHAGILERFRENVRPVDRGFVPEPLAAELFAESSPWSVFKDCANEGIGSDLCNSLSWGDRTAQLVGKADAQQVYKTLRNSTVPSLYWAAVAASSLEELPPSLVEKLKEKLTHESPSVRIATADALARHGHLHDALPVLIDLLAHENLTVVLHAARTIELLGSTADNAAPAMRQLLDRAERLRPSDTPATFVQSGNQDLAMFASFSARAFLDRHDRERASANDSWTPLFDGKSLKGWTARAEGEVSATNGEIQILSKGKNLWLVHEGEFDDFELSVEVLMPMSGYNSGIGFRCTGEGKPKGYQCEIENRKSGMIYAIGSGWVWPNGRSESERFTKMVGDSFKVGTWNRFRIRCEGDHIVIHLNGVLTADVHDDRFDGGAIALQHHGKGAIHRFRNIRIRPLPSRSR